MLKHCTKLHNNGIHVGFIKPSECRLRLLRLKAALQATVTSREFLDLKLFCKESAIAMDDNFWQYLFVMCRALYAPMRVLRLADQKTAAMDKLYFYVCQTDRMLLLWLNDAETKGKSLLSGVTMEVMKGSDELLDVDEDNSSDDDDDYSIDTPLEVEDDGYCSDDEDVQENDGQRCVCDVRLPYFIFPTFTSWLTFD